MRLGQLDVPHALAPHFGLNHFNPALLTHHAAMAHSLVFAAIALVVLGRAEYLGAKQAVALRLESPVIDGFGLLDFAVRPGANFLR